MALTVGGLLSPASDALIVQCCVSGGPAAAAAEIAVKATHAKHPSISSIIGAGSKCKDG